MPAPNWLGDAIGGSLGLLTTAFTANQTKQLAKGQANQIDAQNAAALSIAQENTKAAEIQLKAAMAARSSTGDNTMLYIALGGIGLLVLGAVVFIATKK